MKIGMISLLGILSVFLALSGAAYSADQVLIEYFYMSFAEGCPDCADANVERVNEVIRQIWLEYGEQVVIERLDMWTSEAKERWNFYDLGLFRPTVVINGTLIMKDTPEEPITKERLSDAIDVYLGKADGNPFSPAVKSFQRFLSSEIFLAFSMGFFSGFSPCLMAMLAFILAYTAGTSKGLKGSMSRTFVFGLGLVTAIIIIGILILSLGLPLFPFMTYLHVATLGASAMMIIVGLNLTGILNLPISTKPFVQRLAGKYGYTLLGLFFFGILFFFVKVPCAFPLFIVLLANIAVGATLIDLSLFLAFSVGLLVPFLGIGIIGGGAPRLAKGIREKYRVKIRALSGLVLIGYGIWLLFWQILWQLVW